MNLMNASRLRLSRCAALAAAVAAGGVWAPPAHATTGTWNADAADVWSNAARWTGGIPTAAADIANIQFNIATNRTITIDGAVASRTVGTLTIGDIGTTSNSFTLAANNSGTLTFNNSGSTAVLTQVATSNGDTISAPIILADSINVSNLSTTSTRLLTLSTGGITAGTAGTKNINITGSAAGGITFSGVIGNGAGTVAIVKGNGSNVLTLSGVNTFTGGVTLNAGTLNLNNASALGGTAGAFTIAGGTVSSTSGSAVTLSTNNAQNWNGNFTLGGTQSINFGTGAVTLGGNRQITLSGSGTYTVGGNIGGGFSLTTANGATNLITSSLILSGTNAYTGGTTINGGLVRFSTASAAPATGTITVGNDGALAVGTGSAFATPGALLADGRLATASTGALALTSNVSTDFSPDAGSYNTLGLGAALGVTATYTGLYTPAASTYRVGGGGGTINFTNDSAFTGANSLVAGNGGGGTVVVTGLNNDYTGTTSVPSGTLQFASIGNEGGGASSLGNPSAGNGTITLGAAAGTTGTLRFAGAVSSVSDRGINLLAAGTIDASGTSGATLTLNKPTAVTGTGNLTLGGAGDGSIAAMSQTGGLIKTGAGTWTLTGVNNFTGTTTLSAGTLTLAGDNRLPTTANVILGGGTLNIGANSQTLDDLSVVPALTLSSAINGVGGTLIVNGANDVELGPSNNANPVTVNMAGLSNFTYNSPTKIFRVGLQSGGTTASSTNQIATVSLATNNAITAATLAVGDVNGSANPGNSTLNLGQTNLVNATTVNIGSSGRSGAVLKFNTGLTSPSVTFRGVGGGSTPVTSFLVGRIANNASTVWVSSADFTGGTVDAVVTNMLIGNADTGTAVTRQGTTSASFTMGVGNVVIDTLTLGRIANTGGDGTSTGTTTATFAGSGTFAMTDAASAVTATNIVFSENTITASTGTARTVSGTFALTDGTLKTSTVQLGVQTGTATSVQTAFNWSAGTVQNIDGADLAFTKIPITLSTAAAHLFRITGSNTATIDVDSPISGAAAGISKQGSGSLVLAGNNTYTGPTTITEGTLSIASAQRIADASAMTLAGGTFATAGFSETLADLKLTANSRIDFGNGASILSFAASDLQPWTGTLTVDNWSGDPVAGGGTDRLLFGTSASGLTSGQLSQITFTGFAPGAQILSTGEVVPVPEPSTIAATAGLVAGLLCRRRRRSR